MSPFDAVGKTLAHLHDRFRRDPFRHTDKGIVVEDRASTDRGRDSGTRRRESDFKGLVRLQEPIANNGNFYGLLLNSTRKCQGTRSGSIVTGSQRSFVLRVPVYGDGCRAWRGE